MFFPFQVCFDNQRLVYLILMKMAIIYANYNILGINATIFLFKDQIMLSSELLLIENFLAFQSYFHNPARQILFHGSHPALARPQREV